MQGWNREPKAVVEEFAKLCSETTTLYNLYWHLYEMDAKRLELYDQTAPLTLRDLNHVLIRSVLLEFAKLTDKAKTMGHPNLTSNYIVEEVPWPDEVRARLAVVNERLMEFRKYIESARSKRIAHTDLTAQMDKIADLGKFPKGAERKFLRDLQVFVDIAYGHLTKAKIFHSTSRCRTTYTCLYAP
jgi:hypothetical protein